MTKRQPEKQSAKKRACACSVEGAQVHKYIGDDACDTRVKLDNFAF